ncbi:MAG: PIN domain-containing protein [Planctomycetia bacterium]|nr:PIN domain-containing protein [Planctomycetia bacterium]
MPLTVLYDACVLHPAPLRDLLVRIAATGVVRARWTEQILDECFESILRVRPDLNAEALRRTRELMTEAVPDCLVRGYEDLVGGLKLPDADDRHVLAAAIRAGAEVIVTANLADFPSSVLSTFQIEAKHPDDFVLETIGLAPALVVQVLVEQAGALKRPPRTVEDLLDVLQNAGMARTVAKVRELQGLDRPGDDPP